MTDTTATGLPYGYTVDQLARMANFVVRSHKGLIMDTEEAHDVAAVALVECLYAGSEPSDGDMFTAARRAVNNANSKEKSFVGMELNSYRTGRTGVGREFARYWDGASALVSPFEEKLVERIAVRQVCSGLSPRDREILSTLAEYGTYEDARDCLGLSASRWGHVLNAARREARELWFSPEPTAPQWGDDHPTGRPDPQGRNRGIAHVQRLRNRRARACREAVMA